MTWSSALRLGVERVAAGDRAFDFWLSAFREREVESGRTPSEVVDDDGEGVSRQREVAPKQDVRQLLD